MRDFGSRFRFVSVHFCLAIGLLATQALAGEKPRAPVSPDKIRDHVAFLASDELSGRDSGEPGLEVAAEYIANQFRAYGLAPAGDNGTYFQRFSIPYGASFSRSAGAVVVDASGGEWKLAPGSDVVAFGFGESGSVDAPIAFAGYGITTDADDRKAGLAYDDYAGLDVKGKAVIILRFVPGGESGKFEGRKSPHAALASKLRNARDHGAAAAILVTAPRAPGEDKTGGAESDIEGLAHRASPRHPTLPAVLARAEVVNDILSRAGRDLSSAARRIDESTAPDSFDVTGLRFRVETVPAFRTLRNVAARLEGSQEAPGKQVILVGAHYDHIGRFGNQVQAANLGKIHNGADDNASGAAGALEIARVMAQGGPSPGRAILFVCFSGEEIGLLGSRAWLDAPRKYRVLKETPILERSGGAQAGTFGAGTILEADGGSSTGPLAVKSLTTGSQGSVDLESIDQIAGPDAPHRVAAMINLDMVGHARADAPVTVLGGTSSREFPALLEKISKETGLALQVNEKGLAGGGSDSDSFIGRGIPAIFFFTGMHARYNTPEDDTETLDFAGEARVLEAVRVTVETLAKLETKPAFNASALAQSPGGHGKPKLGVQMDPDFDGDGARVVSIVPETPAAKAGLREGDVIFSFQDKSIRRPSDLVAALEDIPEDEEIPIKVRRAGKEEVVKVIFQARRGGFRVSFGSVPDYGFSGRGVRFEGIRDGTPAAKAGVKAGDVLVKWGPKEVDDVEQWTALLGAQKPGDEVEIELQRAGAKVQLKVKLEARE